MIETIPRVGIRRPSFSDLVLFGVTLTELALVLALTPTFTVIDWLYVSEHIIVLGVALTRRPPKAQDHSLLSSAAVIVAMSYAYAQVLYLGWIPGNALWPDGGLVLVSLSAVLSLASLATLGRRFGIRPALRGLTTAGPYRIVRHPIYLGYLLGDIGYNLQEWNSGTVLLVMIGWIALIYRIYAEERVLSQDAGWPKYTTLVPYRLIPGVW